MKIIKQKCCLHVKNVDFVKDDSLHKHSTLFPSSIRCIICGPSNCGKTNVMISLLEDLNGLRFENVYVYSKSLYQPKYEYLRNLFAQLTPEIGYEEYTDDANIIHPSDAKRNSIFIFDDVACEKQSIIRDFFSMGRHNSIDCFYLCQTYTHIPKHLIRDNANFFILFKQDELNLKHFYRNHVNTDMSFAEFRKICSTCWTNKFGFIVIDKESDLNKGRYRKGLHLYIQL